VPISDAEGGVVVDAGLLALAMHIPGRRANPYLLMRVGRISFERGRRRARPAGRA